MDTMEDADNDKLEKEDDDESSTESEMNRIRGKLQQLEAVAKENLATSKPTNVFECSSTSSSSSSTGGDNDGNHNDDSSLWSVGHLNAEASPMNPTDVVSTPNDLLLSEPELPVVETPPSLQSVHSPERPLSQKSSDDSVTSRLPFPVVAKRGTQDIVEPAQQVGALVHEQQERKVQVPRDTKTASANESKEGCSDDDASSSSSSSSSCTTSSSNSSGSTSSTEGSSSSDNSALVIPKNVPIVASKIKSKVPSNPYVSCKPPADTSPCVAPVATMPLEHYQKQTTGDTSSDPTAHPVSQVPKSANEPELNEEDFLHFFGQDSDDDVKQTQASPFFQSSSSKANETKSPPLNQANEAPAAQFEVSTMKESACSRPVIQGSPPSAIKYTELSSPRMVPLPIQDYDPVVEADSEVHFSFYAPPLYQPREPPVIHRFDNKNRPNSNRRQVPVAQLFESPVRSLWKGKFDNFNALQSELSNALCHSDDHVVVSAPTGAGKTALFEMAIARFITMDLQQQGIDQHHGSHRLSKRRKMVYIAPSKALCEERHDDWTRRLSSLRLGIEVAMITGDGDPSACYHDLASSHLILTTPEKWDSITRRWSENFFLLASVKLLMIDEVHLLGDSSRGSCLEAVISRVKSVQRAAQSVRVSQQHLHSSSYPQTTPQALASSMRTIAVSATLPNIEDVAEFLGASEAYAFDESFRPVPLTKHVSALGYVGKNEYRFWNSLDRHVPELINRFSDGKQTLIFCHTKRETETLVQTLIESNLGKRSSGGSVGQPGTVQYCLDLGVAYHHAGMQQYDRQRVEQAFAEGHLRCLCATSTLAVGVNLPAHLVIIKGTKAWRGGGNGYQDIDKGSLLQMMGRAGRPGLDTSGMAVIMTDNKSKSTVEHLIRGLGSAESRLLPKLVDVVNTEISQRVITDRDGALRWLKTTFLYTRLRQEPTKYAMGSNWEIVDDYLLHLLDKVLGDLGEADLVLIGTNGSIQPVPASHIMSQSMVPFDSMKLIATLPYDATQYQLLKTLAKMETFHYNLRRHEKKPLNECHKTEVIRFKLDGPISKVRIQQPWEKAFVLLQAYIGQHAFENFTLGQEMSKMTDNAQRILLAAQEFSIKGSRNGYVAYQCLKLRRSLHFALWGSTSGVLNQFDGVGLETTNKLKFHGISSFQHIISASEEGIAKASGETISFAKRAKALVSKLLRSRLKLSAEVEYTRGSNLAAGAVCHLEPFDSAASLISEPQKSDVTYTLIAFTDQSGTCILFREGITGPGSYRFSPPAQFGKLYVHLIASIVGMDAKVELDGNDDPLPSTFVDAPTRKQHRCRNNDKKEQKNQTKSDSLVQDPRVSAVTSGPYQTDIVALIRKQRRRQELEQSTKLPGGHTVQQSQPQVIEPMPAEPCKNSLHHPGPSGRLNSQIPRRSEEMMHQTTNPRLIRKHDRRNSTRAIVAPQLVVRESISYRETVDHGLVRDNTDILRSGRQASAQDLSPKPATVTPMEMTPGDNTFSSYRGRAETAQDPIRTNRHTPNAWHSSKRKQQKTQQRAFASKRDNPFAFFQHDPNDAESFLEDLSHTNSHAQNTIIPEAALQKSSNRTVQQSHTPQPRRTRHWNVAQKRRPQGSGNNRRVSDQDLLRMKAAEASSYSFQVTPSVYRSPYTTTAMAHSYPRNCDGRRSDAVVYSQSRSSHHDISQEPNSQMASQFLREQPNGMWEPSYFTPLTHGQPPLVSQYQPQEVYCRGTPDYSAALDDRYFRDATSFAGQWRTDPQTPTRQPYFHPAHIHPPSSYPAHPPMEEAFDFPQNQLYQQIDVHGGDDEMFHNDF